MKLELSTGTPLIVSCFVPTSCAVQLGLSHAGPCYFPVRDLIDALPDEIERKILTKYVILESGDLNSKTPLTILAPTLDAVLTTIREEAQAQRAKEQKAAELKAHQQALLDGPEQDLIEKIDGFWQLAKAVNDLPYNHISEDIRGRARDVLIKVLLDSPEQDLIEKVDGVWQPTAHVRNLPYRMREVSDHASRLISQRRQQEAVEMLIALSPEARDEVLLNKNHTVSALATTAGGEYLDRANQLHAERIEATARAAHFTITALLNRHGTDSQNARWAAGCLPEKEIEDLARDQLFAPWDRYDRYTRWSQNDLTCDCNEGASFSTQDVDMCPLTETEFSRYTAIRSHVDDVPESSIVIRQHMIECRACNDSDMTRLAARITIQWAGYTFTREYNL